MVIAGSSSAIPALAVPSSDMNPISHGGRVTDTDVEEFLNRTGSSPENLALRALLDKRGGS
jgi:hypothetical protein